MSNRWWNTYFVLRFIGVHRSKCIGDLLLNITDGVLYLFVCRLGLVDVAVTALTLDAPPEYAHTINVVLNCRIISMSDAIAGRCLQLSISLPNSAAASKSPPSLETKPTMH